MHSAAAPVSEKWVFTMIKKARTPYTEEESLEVLNGYVREWFVENFKGLTPPQRYSFKLISEGKNVIIAAPTGSGKTMSAFLSIISRLFQKSIDGTLEDKIYCIYVSPLRALNNDIYRNLMRPLDAIYESIRREKGLEIMQGSVHKVTIGVRTGDTTPRERAKMLVKPPNILVTTPESLAILINSEKFSENMKSLEFLIIDELHELASNKRGVHLSLSVERLGEMIGHDFVRVGLGATLYPLEEAARFLAGYSGGRERDCIIVDASWSKKLDLIAVSPSADMIYTDEKVVEELMYAELNRIISSSRTTLVFTNTRSGTERVVFNLKNRFKYGDEIVAHHGSLSRGIRFDVEEMLKKGEVKCAVSSTSLELGVDIGMIDNVVQIGSPKSVTRALQRIGRAGHSYKATAKGEVIVLNRDDLVECAIMLYAALNRHLDSFNTPRNALDVLAQHVVGMSLTRRWKVDEALEVVRRAHPFHTLKEEEFLSVLNYLAGSYVELESKKVYGKIWYDEKEGVFGKRGKMAKVIYMLNLGTIPDSVSVDVFTGDKKRIGSIEEEFLGNLKQGDIFALGGKLYSFDHASELRCYVSEAKTRTPTIPPWFSEQLPLSYELAVAIGNFRERLSDALSGYNKKHGISRMAMEMEIPEEASAILDMLPIDAKAKEAIFRYFEEQLLFAGTVPNDKLMLIEQTKDTTGTNYLIFHALYGRRVNDAMSRMAAIAMSDLLKIDVGVLVNDNGFVLTTEKEAQMDEKIVKGVMERITSENIFPVLKANIRRTELMRRKFRHVAARSFMVLKNYKGWRATVRRQQINAQLLLKAAEEIDPDFPVIRETYREIFEDMMDLPKARDTLRMLKGKVIRYKFIKTPSPSPFSHMMITFGHADVVLMKDRQERLQYLHRLVMSRIGKEMERRVARHDA